MPLTDTKVKKLKPEQKLYRIADSNGLAIEVKPSGVKVWRFRYRFDGKASMMSLGSYPIVTLADARSKRDEARALLASGINPTLHNKELQEQRKLAALTVEAEQDKMSFNDLFCYGMSITVIIGHTHTLEILESA